MPPSLAVCNTDSLGEQIQRAFPDARVVKTLNTDQLQRDGEPRRGGGRRPQRLRQRQRRGGQGPGAPRSCAGGSAGSTSSTSGDITTARGTEAYLLLWVRLWGALQTADFNLKVVR